MYVHFFNEKNINKPMERLIEIQNILGFGI
jgi:hypothetical protein